MDPCFHGDRLGELETFESRPTSLVDPSPRRGFPKRITYPISLTAQKETNTRQETIFENAGVDGSF